MNPNSDNNIIQNERFANWDGHKESMVQPSTSDIVSLVADLGERGVTFAK